MVPLPSISMPAALYFQVEVAIYSDFDFSLFPPLLLHPAIESAPIAIIKLQNVDNLPVINSYFF